ncbi:SusE domain-containing protein [Hymenobacter convexus]|uniref:SusE domain-containing protein n=1 Tax=Hymenobacter sp. CA1UV-4 TaxID=3063782 RepID=UPI0027129812|nr:SusE domain-containing protein [Hymenobacter sp. CA1UV-4]MDO7851976.1 SusE domain-containing protein [Hymenobacter sp. CA1UV-4]
MKNLLTQALAVAFALTSLASCTKDENKVTVAPSGTLSLTASTNTVVLTQLNDANNAITYNWNAVNFSLSGTEYTKAPAVTYQVQIAKSADGFGYPAVFDAGANMTKTITVYDLNNGLNAIGIATQTPVVVYARVVAVVGTDTHTFASAPVALTATAYPACVAPNKDTWALVGPAGLGWPSGGATEDGIPMTWNCALQAYTARTNLNAGDFKFRLDKAWSVNLGGAGNLTQGVPLSLNGANLTIATAGTYTVKLTVNGVNGVGTGVTGGTVTVTP